MSKGIRIKTFAHTVILSAIIALPVCLLGQAAHSKPAPKPAKSSDPLHDEAMSIASDLWNSTLAHCGDSYYYLRLDYQWKDYAGFLHGQTGTLYQYRNVSFGLSPTHGLTEAQELNGIEWDGDAYMTTSVYRKSDSLTDLGEPLSKAVWGSWTDTSSVLPIVPSYHITKQNGQWMANDKPLQEARNEIIGVYWKPATCKDILGTAVLELTKQQKIQIPKAEALLHTIETRGGPQFQYMTVDSNIFGGDKKKIEGTLSSFLSIRQNIPNDSIVIFPVGNVKSEPIAGYMWKYGAGFAVFLRARTDVADYWPPREAYLSGDTPITAAERLYEQHSPSGSVKAGTVCAISWEMQELKQDGTGTYIPLPYNALINDIPWVGQSGHLFEVYCYDNGQFRKSSMRVRVIDLSATEMEYLPNAEGWVSTHSQN